MKRFLYLGTVLFLSGIWAGCGETFRPIIIPNPPQFPNPAAAHSVVSINDNGGFVAGSAMSVDVAGDSIDSIANTDIHPIHAAQQSTTEVLVLNQAVTEAETGDTGTANCLLSISTYVYDVCPSLTFLNFSSTTISSTSDVTLPIYSSPNFVAIAPSATTAYVTLPTYPPDPNDPGTMVPSVAVVAAGTSKSVTSIVPVGSNPYALAVTPDSSKLYVANQGDGTISAFNAVSTGLSARTVTIDTSTGSLTSPPIWLSARSDSQAVYVLEQTSGLLAYISITSSTGPDTLTESTMSVPGAIKMVYDPNLIRLYIPGGSQVAIVDVSQPVPALLATIPITAVNPAARSAQDPCLATAVTTLVTADAAALPNGTQAYFGSYYEAAVSGVNYICPQVTAIDATSNSIAGSPIAIPGFPAYDAFCSTTRFRISMVPGGDSTRAYLASCDGGNVNIIDTATNSYLENQLAPVGTRQTTPPSALNLPQSPVFLLAGP